MGNINQNNADIAIDELQTTADDPFASFGEEIVIKDEDILINLKATKPYLWLPSFTNT